MAHPPFVRPDQRRPVGGASGTTRWVVGGALVPVVTVLLGVVLMVAAVATPTRQPSGATGTWGTSVAAAKSLAVAAVQLTSPPAVHYGGTVTGPRGPVGLDVAVTRAGSLHGTARLQSEQVEVLGVGGHTYLRARPSFWTSAGGPSDSVTAFGNQWVRASGTELGVDPLALVAPASVARELAAASAGRRVQAGRLVDLDGVPARPLRTTSGTTYLSTDDPPQVLRVERTASPTAGTEPGYALDLHNVAGSAYDELASALESRTKSLRAALDGAVRFSVAGAVRLAPCGTSGCTATVTLRNSISSANPYVDVRKPVTAAITISMTLDGRPVSRCAASRTMPPNGTTSMSCSAAYYIPPARRPTTHYVRAFARATARALAEADVRKLQDDLTKERQAEAARNTTCSPPTFFASYPATPEGTVDRRAPSTRDTITTPALAPRSPRPPGCGVRSLITAAGLPTTGKVRFVPRRDTTPSGKLDRGTNRGYRDRFDNEWVRGPVRSQKALERGYRYEWDVQLTDRAKARYRWLCARERGNIITHLNVMPNGEISHVVCQ